MMERGGNMDYIVTKLPLQELLILSHQRHHHPLDLQLFLWNEIRVTGIFRAQIRFATLQDKSFKRDLAINQRGDHIAGAWLTTILDDRNIAIDDILADHGIAAHFEAERARARLNAQSIDIHQNTPFFLLRS